MQHYFKLLLLKTVTMVSCSWYDQCTKRMKKSSTLNWGELHSSILDSIFQNLSFKDVLRVQSVSSHWFSVSKALIASKTQSHAHSNHTQIPYLMLPPEDEKREHSNGNFCCYINMKDKRVHEIDINTMLMDDTYCNIGSSHGWLIFLDKKGSLSLLNPFIQVKIHLPSLYSLLGIRKIEKNINLGEYNIKYNNRRKNSMIFYTRHLRENVIYKCVLSSNPCHGVNNLGVVVIYGRATARKLAYYNYGDGHHDSCCWREVDGRFWPYHDIVCYKNQLYALGTDNACVEVWDLDGHVPIKRKEIKLCFPPKSMKMLEDRYLYVSRLYLVENLGDWLLVVRFIGEYVNENNVAVREEDLLIEEEVHPLVCPYKTLLFHVYKLDFDERRWVEVESLGDSAVFIGGSHAISVSCQGGNSVSGYKKNSIYYTDDYWGRMEEDYLYGGHDAGVFSLEDQRVETIYQSGSMKIQPSPCWVAPSLW